MKHPDGNRFDCVVSSPPFPYQVSIYQHVIPNPLVFVEPNQSAESKAAQALVVEAVERGKKAKVFKLFLRDLENKYRGWLLNGDACPYYRKYT